MNTVAFDVKRDNGNLIIRDSKGDEEVVKTIEEYLYFLLEPYDDNIKVVWNIPEFIKPLLALFPKDIAHKIKTGTRVEYNGFRIWLGLTRHGHIFGVSYKEIKPIKGNIYEKKQYDTDIYELKQYFPKEKSPLTVDGLADKGDYLVTTLGRMGLTPKKLSSAAGIYKECVLDKMPVPTLWTMPEKSFPMMELAANYIREWHGDYASGNWDKKPLFKADLSAAYPWALSTLPNLKYADYVPFTEIKESMDWGIFKGKLTIDSPVSTIVDESGTNKVGEFEDEVITSDDWASIEKWGIGKFEPESGWYITLKKDVKIFDYIMRRLFEYRGGNVTRDTLAKAMSVSVWGQFMVMHGTDFGDYFNGIYACMVTSKVRARVCDYIYENNLQDDLVEVTVDGFRSKKELGISKQSKFGEWRQV